MSDYIIFIRGINVSGKNILKMKLLKETLLKYDFTNVQTYIQSGNVFIQDSTLSKNALKLQIEDILEKDFNIQTTVLIQTVEEVKILLTQIPFSTENTKQLYFTFIDSIPNNETVLQLKGNDYKGDQFTISKNCIYIQCINGFGKTKLNNNFFEKKLSVKATTRNYNTLVKMTTFASKD